MSILFLIMATWILIMIKTHLSPVEADSCKTCGVSESENRKGKVFNGEKVEAINKYPWIIFLEIHQKSKTFGKCMGTLISPTFVLTAAHCLFREDEGECPETVVNASRCHQAPDKIFASPMINSTFSKDKSKRTTFPVSKVIVHEGYQRFDSAHDHNDVALLKLKKAVKCDSSLQTLCLPTTDLQTYDKDITIAGMGQDPEPQVEGESNGVLKEGLVRRIATAKCFTAGNLEARKKEEIFCNNGKDAHQSTCEGDSGSTLFAKFEDVYYALAVTSSGESPDCDPKQPNSDVDLVAYLPWIQKFVKEIPKPPTIKKNNTGRGG